MAQSDVTCGNLDDYEYRAGCLIALHRALGERLGLEPTMACSMINLTEASGFEDAAAAGERFAPDYGLGDISSRRLADVMEKDLGIFVLMVDPIRGMSGAACHLPGLDAVPINRREVLGRHRYNLAQELLHILTRYGKPPKRIEEIGTPARDRVEELADNFSGSFLISGFVLDCLVIGK